MLSLQASSPEARMAEETYSFRATLYLEGSSRKNEVRRFVLPKNALTDFLFLEKKLKTVFQSLQSLTFNVTWEDSEGEEVLISSDEELKIAINEMKGEVYRLKIEVKSASGSKDENAEVHPGVHCDGCGGEVKGFRYKCIQCPNYDLCSACEMKCLHKEHYMIRLPQPIAFPQVLQYMFRNAWDSNDDLSSAQDFGAEGAPPQNESERKDVDKSSQDKDDSRLKYLKTTGETVATLLDPLARMAEETSTFQATLYLEGSSGKKEVRRFVLPKNASTNYLLLEEKLKTVFQSLQSLPFSVTWEASEGEEVLISSDEELKIAINEMKGEVYRLKIEVKCASDLKDENAEDNKTEEEVPLNFHERTGRNIVLSNNKRTATGKNYEANISHGSVITNRPLKDNELFEVLLEKFTTKYGNAFSLGVTVANPTTVSFKGYWNNFNDGVWIYYYHGIWNNGNIIQRGYGINLQTLKVGDRVGVMRKSNGSLHFFVNGADQGAIPTTVPEEVYGVMDVYGAAVQATIVKP